MSGPSGIKSYRHGRKPESTPHSKKPKSRPPSGLRDTLPIHGTLPKYSGPYNVGIMDIEVPAEEPRAFSSITRHGRHIIELETVLMSVYYPSGFGSGQGRAPSGHKRWSRESWLSRPRPETAGGYAKFAGLPKWPTTLWFMGTTWFTKLPAFRNVELARHWPPEQNARRGGLDVTNEVGKPPPGEPEQPCFPLLIFSHGLGGTKTTYSSVCGEFASYGFVVCALEHRDGSGPRTFVNHPKEGEGSRQEMEQNGRVSHWDSEKNKPWDKIDYLFPKDNPRDTAPNNDSGVDHELRAAQIELRLAEIEEAYKVMSILRNGDGELIAKRNLRVKGAIGASSRGLDGVDWASWKGRFHLEQVTIVGHSFGAATTIEILRHADRFKWVTQGIIYDIWGAALNPPEDVPEHRIHTPLLGINSEAFMYWPANFKAVTALMDEAKEQGALCWLLTLRGSVHLSQSDFSLLYPHLCSLLLKMTANPKRILDLNINASLEFLKLVMPERISAINRALDNENLLQKETLDELPDEHRPDPKWMAARLKIPHEMSSRLTPNLKRKAKRLGASDGEDEIWMHIAPTQEDLRKHGMGPSEEFTEERGSGLSEHFKAPHPATPQPLSPQRASPGNDDEYFPRAPKYVLGPTSEPLYKFKDHYHEAESSQLARTMNGA
ncbi:MAG: hypothetical protein M1827_001250 [Pycnora praestabilis]|nr:MAG: hypothetical protein M1827_001250 [Pycnora praestabilis]